MLESEYKTLISHKDFEELIDKFSFPVYNIQKNFYFDSNEFDLFNHGETMKLRILNNNAIFIFKSTDTSSNLLTKREESEILTIFNTAEIPNNIKIYEHPDLTLKNYGELKTCRYYLVYKGWELSLDHNKYLGTEDFEIELEEKNTTVSLNTIVNELGLGSYLSEKQKKTESKSYRFLSRLKFNNSKR
ncbi:CYTH domain-containing protein [Companilactobacillus metriopterae]|uniref:CYTH domain-containing protein n=1 Tax=Companilactobacillus metriopterae TaxID=1909267 RepID=UPI00100B445F|nr:CYTH domain-containing protein [Companilactobacillus metriopterae]